MISMLSLRFGTSSVSPSRPPTPPPPAVDWATATHELSKLLVPTERSISSHTAAELAQPKIKKERLSIIGLAAAPPAPSGRQLRDRSKAPAIDIVSGNRRQTIATDTPIAASRDPDDRLTVQRRKSSIGSQTTSTASTISARPAAGVPVKKARAMKPPVVPESRKASSRGSSVQNLTQRFQQAKISSATSTSEVLKTNGNANMAKTTTGTQRLKINVPSDIEYASRQPKPAAAARKPPVARASKAVPPKKPAAKAKVSPPATTNCAPDLVTGSASEMPPPPPRRSPTAGDGLTTPPQAAPKQQGKDQVDAPDSGISSGFSHDPLSFQPQPQIVLQTQDITWTTPYAGPPSNFESSPIEDHASPTAGRTQANPKPPVFTSTGHIPFSPAKPAPGSGA